jgi:hypothetical protein
MAYIEVKRLPHSKGEYYYEVSTYRDDNGKVKHKRRYLGTKLPKDLRYVVGYRGTKQTEGKRVQVFKVKLGMEDYLDQTGTIKEVRKKYALVVFDKKIRGRNDWLLPFEMLGNIRKRGLQ